MNFWFSITLTGFYFLRCYCQKLTCNEIVTDEYVNPDFEVNFKLFDIDSDGNLVEEDFFPKKDSIYFDATRKTIVVIRGFTNDYAWVNLMAQEWLKRESVNFISVERENYNIFDIYRYRKAALESEIIAEKASNFMRKLIQKNKEKMNMNFHFVGHSLGTHIVGQTARLLQENGIKVQRITALDPAFPCFENDSAELRLRKTDAEFMDVIHTNCEPGDDNKGNYGIYDPLGHADFYVNGGLYQPACENVKRCSDIDSPQKSMDCWLVAFLRTAYIVTPTLSPKALSLLLQLGTQIDTEDIIKKVLSGKEVTCEHEESIYYFIDSLDPRKRKMWSNPTSLPMSIDQDLQSRNRKCYTGNSDCVEMGINADLYKNDSGGIYYVEIMN